MNFFGKIAGLLFLIAVIIYIAVGFGPGGIFHKPLGDIPYWQ